jgi:hypothetical protein
VSFTEHSISHMIPPSSRKDSRDCGTSGDTEPARRVKGTAP